MNIKKLFVLLIFLAINHLICSQRDIYIDLQKKYEYFKNNNNMDSALLFAKKLNLWTFKNEGDTSLRYAVSYRYIGNSFISSDSALYYYNRSLQLLKKQKRDVHTDYSKGLNNIANIYINLGDYINAENYYR